MLANSMRPFVQATNVRITSHRLQPMKDWRRRGLRSARKFSHLAARGRVAVNNARCSYNHSQTIAVTSSFTTATQSHCEGRLSTTAVTEGEGGVSRAKDGIRMMLSVSMEIPGDARRECKGAFTIGCHVIKPNTIMMHTMVL